LGEREQVVTGNAEVGSSSATQLFGAELGPVAGIAAIADPGWGQPLQAAAGATPVHERGACQLKQQHAAHLNPC
jgi:hypothetical protein